MANQTKAYWPLVTAVIGVLALIIALPDSAKTWAPSFLKPDVRLGLDLAGGTQLDFRISEEQIVARKAELQTQIAELEQSGATEQLLAKQNELTSLETQHDNIVEAIRTVLERRINALGVSEATITPSYYGTEKHLLVDCPGVIDPQECIATVGKTIQLEFKEEETEVTAEFTAGVRSKADSLSRAIAAGSGTLQSIGQDQSSQLGTAFADAQPFFRDELPKGMEGMWDRKAGEPAVRAEGSTQVPRQKEDGSYEIVDVPGIYIAEVVSNPSLQARTLSDPKLALQEINRQMTGSTLRAETAVPIDGLDAALKTQLTTMQPGTTATASLNDGTAIIYLQNRTDGTQKMELSHILISYKGATSAADTVIRSKAEAKKRADDVKKQLDDGASFNDLARTQSDAASAAQNGSLGTVTKGSRGAAFDAAAFALKNGQMSAVAETEFGYHIFRADSEVRNEGATVTFSALTLPETAKSRAEELKQNITDQKVARSEQQIVLRFLFLSLEPTGWKDTELNGQHFRSAAVSIDPITNIPVVQIQFDEKGAELFREITKRNINKPVAIFVGGELISAPTVQQEITGGTAVISGVGNIEEARLMAQDLNTGAIPAPIYLSGQTTMEATLGTSALSESVRAGFIGLIVLIIFMISIYRVLGLVAGVSLIFYLILLMALMKLPLFLVTDQHIVLTLAGIAGIILSLGMAVDANVLIYERMKEEIQKGKGFVTAADTGFKRAWPSIRDGNASTLITSAILFLIGTSIVRGFAITLSIGLVLSLFTAIIVTRWFIGKIAQSPLAHHPANFGMGKKDSSHNDGE